MMNTFQPKETIMTKDEIRQLEKQMDEYFENKVDAQVIEDVKKHGFQINDDVMSEIEDPANGIILQPPVTNQRKGNKGYINHKNHK